MNVTHSRHFTLGRKMSALALLLPLLGCPSTEELPVGSSDTSDDTDATTSATTTPVTSSSSTSVEPPGSSTQGDPGTTQAPTDSVPDSTTGDELPCGNGVLDEGEQCDDGYEHNGPGQNCNQDCTLGFCGDGVTQKGLGEACDGENLGEYGGCTSECQLGPHCGDNVFQEDHEWCECVDQNPMVETCAFTTKDGELVACDADTCRFNGKLVFLAVPEVDDGGWTGRIEHDGMVGVEAADWICDELADKAGLAHLPAEGEDIAAPRFRAWLSAPGESVVDRFTKSATGYVLRSGKSIADDWGQLISEGPEAPINQTQHEGDTRVSATVWSNTTIAGSNISATEHCGSWMVFNIPSKGRIGKIPNDDDDAASWTDAPEYNPSFCADFRYLYCFEQ